MTVNELKLLLDKVYADDAEVRVANEDDNFFDGGVVTGINVMHNMVGGRDTVRVFVIGDASETKN